MKITLANLREEILRKFKEMNCKEVMDEHNPTRVDYVIATKEQAQQVKNYILKNCASSIKEQIERRSVSERDFEEVVNWSGMYHTYIGTFRANVNIRVAK